MILVVTGVGALIHIFSVGYKQTTRGTRATSRTSTLFVFFMLVLVLWCELPSDVRGLGRRRPLLLPADRILVQRQRRTPTAGKKAFIVNRIGDFGFLVAMLCCSRYRRSRLSRSERQGGRARHGQRSGHPICLVSCFLGCTGKSAQIPALHLASRCDGWSERRLRAHPCGRTMVTAGVYLISAQRALFSFLRSRR